MNINQGIAAADSSSAAASKDKNRSSTVSDQAREEDKAQNLSKRAVNIIQFYLRNPTDKKRIRREWPARR